MQCVCGNSDFKEFHHYLDGKRGNVVGVACGPCGQEWLREEYLTRRGKSQIIFDNTELHEQRTLPEECQTSFQVKGSRTKIEKGNLGVLNVGDHITWHRPYVIWHHAIVIGVDVQRRRLKVIHWTSPEAKDDHKCEITTQWLNINKQYGDLFRIDYPLEIAEKNPPNLVLARAYSRVGETDYHLLKNNCEGLAAFCKTGVAESCQKNWFWSKMQDIGKLALVQSCKAIVKSSCVGLTEAAKAGAIASAKVSIAETIETVTRSTDLVGAGIVVVMEGAFCIYDLTHMYKTRNDGKISRKDFIESSSQRLTEAIVTAGFAVGGSLVGEFVGGAVGGILGTMTLPVIGTVAGTTFAMFVGSIVGGIVGSLCGKLCGTFIGQHVGKMAACCIKRDDRAVKSITDVSEGDHIVFRRRVFHPRHHAIVVGSDVGGSRLKIVHNTHEKGVVEEWIDFIQPMYKMIYSENQDPALVTFNASSRVGEKRYSVWSYNCKHFAIWCHENNWD